MLAAHAEDSIRDWRIAERDKAAVESGTHWAVADIADPGADKCMAERAADWLLAGLPLAAATASRTRRCHTAATPLVRFSLDRPE